MKKKVANLSEQDLLRQRAEVVFKKDSALKHKLPLEADTLKLLHELQVHQIELEMQNEELMQAKELAEVATKKAVALFDFAPSGYFTVTRNGEIIELNLTGAKMLGKDRQLLKNRLLTLFIAPSSKSIFIRFLFNVFQTSTKQSCELEISSNGISTWILFTGLVIENSPHCWLTGENITELKQNEEALQRSELRFKNMFDRHNAIMLLIDPKSGRIIDANDAATQFYGYNRSKLLSIGMDDINVPASNEINIDYAQVFREERNNFVFTHQLANGEKRVVEIHSSHIDMQGHRILYLIIHDITNQKLADETIKKSETILRLFIEHSPAAIAMFDCQMKYIVASNRFLIDYDIEDQNIIGRSHYEIFPEIPQRRKEIHNRCLAGSTERCEEDPFLRKSGKLDWIKWEICPWYETDNNIGGIILFSEVVTERKQAAENLRTSMQLTKDIIDNTPSLFYIVDLEGRFVLANQKFEEITGIQVGRLIGNTREPFLPKVIADQHRANDLAVIESNRSLTFEEENLESDGIHFYMTQKFPLFNSEGKVYAVGGISADITENKLSVEKLKISEAKWHNLFEILPVGVSIVDSNNKVIEFNPALNQILDISKEGLLRGDYTKRLYFRQDSALMSSEEFPSNRSKKEGKVIRDVKIGVQKEDGSVIWTNVSAAPLPLINATVTVTTDITEPMKAEEKLLLSEAKWRSFVSNSPDFIALHDRNGRFLFLNHYAEGFSEKDVLGKSLFNFVSKESVDKYSVAFEKCIQTMKKQEIEHKAMGDNGEMKIYESSLVPININSDEINVIVVARDITLRKKADKEIRKSREQLAELYRHLNEVREEERTSIAREIHDDLGQSLAGLKIDLIGIKEDIHDKILSGFKIDKAISLVDTTIKTVRKLSSELRPQMLDELGLASAIEWQSNEFKKRTNIKCKLELDDIEDLTENIAISLFRIFQAALTNIMLHSKAKSISVKLGIKDKMIQLRINDDGIGITHEQLHAAKSFGLIGMRERANQISGKFEINTGVNIGTEIIVRIPVK